MIATDITIVSTYATDRIYDATGNWIWDQQGGPCLFIVDAMQHQRISYRTLTPAKKALVDIKLDKAGEIGTVKSIPAFEVDWSSITSPYLLISTLLDEISLIKIEMYNGKICLDVQGFVRKARSDDRTTWTMPHGLYENCFCLKATEEELEYMPSRFVEQQKQKLLVVTRGPRGVEYWEKGKHKEAFPKEIIACSETIGAGDTFFCKCGCWTIPERISGCSYKQQSAYDLCFSKKEISIHDLLALFADSLALDQSG